MSDNRLKHNLKELKENGFLQQVEEDYFSLRVKVVGGQLTAEHVQDIGEIARKYGRGNVHFTSRQAVEVPFIKGADIEAVKTFLREKGLQPGVLGATVRTITACQGSQVCKHGNIDTTRLAERLTAFTAGVVLPHKFKIGITGCANNCLKAEENDLGIKGAMETDWAAENCTYCGLCAAKCPGKAIRVNKGKKTLFFNREKCINCGKCVRLCPVKAWSGKGGYALYFGGTFGNRILIGQRLGPLVFSEDGVEQLVDKTLKYYQQYGKKGERFGFIFERNGLEGLRLALEEVKDNDSVQGN